MDTGAEGGEGLQGRASFTRSDGDKPGTPVGGRPSSGGPSDVAVRLRTLSTDSGHPTCDVDESPPMPSPLLSWVLHGLLSVGLEALSEQPGSDKHLLL